MGFSIEGKEGRSLAERIRAGDSAAESDLAARYRERVFVMALSRLNAPEGAADVAQEVMLSVLVSLRGGRLRNADSLASFIYGTARNLINNHLRSQAQSKEAPIPEGLAYDDGSDPELAARASAVGRALQSLRPQDREILAMSLVDNLKSCEIESLLRITGDAVRARKSRALRRLRARLSRNRLLWP